VEDEKPKCLILYREGRYLSVKVLNYFKRDAKMADVYMTSLSRQNAMLMLVVSVLSQLCPSQRSRNIVSSFLSLSARQAVIHFPTLFQS
jgi:hypothetical protein